MKIYWVYKHFPAFIFSTDFFVSANAAATTFGPLVFIRPSKTFPIVPKNEAEGLREHELIHVEQFYRTCGLNGLRYLFSKKWKLKYEVEAYRKQLEFVPEDVEKFAVFLSTRYGLNITKEDALKLLIA